MSLLPVAVHALIEVHCAAAVTDLAPTFGGASHLTVHARLNGAPCVIKAATTPTKRADVAREALLLPSLYALALPVAPVLARIHDPIWTVSILGALPGLNGLQLLTEQPHALPAVYYALGQALQAVHTAPWPDHKSAQSVAADFALPLRVQAAQATLAKQALPPELSEPIFRALAHPIWQTTPCLIHGDVGLHNLLWADGLLGLVDWEWAGIGPALLDLAWLRWTMAWRALPASLWDAFCRGYGALPAPLEAALATTLALGQIGLILARVVDQPAATAEWLRRTRWTLELYPVTV